MKKLLSIFATAIIMLAFASCESSEGSGYEIADNITIVSNDVSFDPKAQSGTIKVIAPGAITLKYDAPWMTAAVNGGTITVTVEQNNSLEGRAAVLTIQSEGESKNITVQQLGFVFDLDLGGATSLKLDDKKFSKSYNCTSNLDIEISTTADWLTGELADGKLTIAAEENTTGNLRSAALTYKVVGSDVEETITVSQCEFAKDIAGDYYFAFLDSGKVAFLNATLGQDENGEFISIPNYNWTLRVDYDPATYVITLSNNQFMGMFEDYYVHNIAWDDASGYIIYTQKVYQTAEFVVETDEEGNEFVIAYFVDNGVWGTRVASSINIYAASGTPVDSKNRVGSLLKMVNPFLQKK